MPDGQMDLQTLNRLELLNIKDSVMRAEATVGVLRDEIIPQMREQLAQMAEWRKGMEDMRTANHEKWTLNDQEHKELSRQVWISIGAQSVILAVAIAIMRVIK